MNKVIFMGRLTKEPVQKTTINGKYKVEFSIAVNKKFKKDGGVTADFFECEAWETQAEAIFKYFHQGDGILVTGRMENNNYTNRDGQKIYGMVVKVEEWDFGPKKLGREGTPQGGNYGNNRGYTNNGGNQYGGFDGYGTNADGFMNIPDGIDEELPFN